MCARVGSAVRRSQSASATVKPLVAGEVARRGVWCELSQLAPEKLTRFVRAVVWSFRQSCSPEELIVTTKGRHTSCRCSSPTSQGLPRRQGRLAEGRGLVTEGRPRSGPKGPASRGRFPLFLIPYGGNRYPLTAPPINF